MINNLISDILTFIFNRSINLFDFWAIMAIAHLHAEYDTLWVWVLFIPAVAISGIMNKRFCGERE